MPHKNSDKEPTNERVVQSVIKRYEEQQSTPMIDGQNQSRYELMTKLSPRTMCALLGELTQDVVGQVSLQNVHDMEKIIQSENIHYDNMAKQLGTLNKLMNKLVGQISQPKFPSIGNQFQARTIVGHNSPVLSPNQGIEPPFIPSTSNSGGGRMANLSHNNGASNLGVARMPQMIPPINQPIGVPYDANMVLDCLEEEVTITKDLDDEAMGIMKFGHAQAQNALVMVNIGDGQEDRPTFISQMLSKEGER
ncbi:hypothetical protein Adt_44996 [Abeliophyllum distichum]|uniref:Uncharacterized protein n=1 Tax=Abeliophyllum distichum TaxID=126358 RepID=A0ABD1PG80_9LAMI